MIGQGSLSVLPSFKGLLVCCPSDCLGDKAKALDETAHEDELHITAAWRFSKDVPVA